jgi:hypothetical protein
MAKRVFVLARDLLFRARLRHVIERAGAAAADEAGCDLAVVEIDAPAWEQRVRAIAGRGIPVLAFGSHVHADRLRLARDAGARAVPNSQVEATLTEMLG